jgi:hypothetical protein
MIKAVVHTKKYFQAPQNYFWRWAERGEVIEWAGGSTICYRDDLITILKELSAKGLPPFGSLLLVLAACKKELQMQEEFFLRRAQKNLNDPSTMGLLDDATRLMHIISALPAELKTGLHRVHLIYEVFEDAGFVFSNVQVKDAVDELNSGRIDELIFEAGEAITNEQFINDLRYLSNALKRYPTTESLVLKLRTGLDALPEAAEINLPQGTPPDLLDQLAQDPKTSGISRLARRVMAALNIPMHSTASGDLSFGGITDITNRGNYDKLLLSELAHDNDLLMARLVNNEALYFQREEPPENPKRQRTILVDTTLKMWGVPRVFAISAALAFAYNVKHDELVEAYALGGKLFNQIRLDTKEGVTSSLEILDHSLHCGKALQRVVSEIAATEYNEFIFITAEHIFNSPAFHASLADVRDILGFILTVNRDGKVMFYECKKGRMKLLSTAKFDLDELLFAPAEFPKIKTGSFSGPVPAFLSVAPPPLLFPKVRIKMVPEKLFDAGEAGIIVINESQRVLRIPKKGSGAYEVLNYLEKGTYSFGIYADDVLCIMVNNIQRNLLKYYEVNLSSASVDMTDLSGQIQYATDARFYQNSFYIRTDHEVFSFDCGLKKVVDKKDYRGFPEMFQEGRSKNSEARDLKKAGEYIYPYDSIMYKIRQLYIGPAGKLVLGNYTLSMVRDELNIRINENVVKETGIHFAKEVMVNSPMLQNKLIRFAVRRWDDGSEAVLDARGLLHLKSSDPSIPEITIVLVTGIYTACWASDGTACGFLYFIDEALVKVIPVAEFYKKNIQCFIDRVVRS